MKKGFLISSKAKAKSRDRDSKPVAARSRPDPEIVKPLYGVVENTEKPQGYEVQRPIMKEMDPLAPPERLPEDMTLYTTQPSIAMNATPANHEGWTECLLYPQVKALILATPGFPARLLKPSAPNYRLVPIPDKGQGLVSTANIHASDLILSERPLTLTPASASLSKFRFLRELSAKEKYLAALYEWEHSLKILFDRLHPDYQAAFMALANSHQHDGSGPIMGIIRTNGMGVRFLEPGKYSTEAPQPGDKGMYTAVCKEISRLNHSCCPNTIAYFDRATFSYQLFAARDIAEGEELTLTYIGLTVPAEARQSKLEPYGFRCTCPACHTSSVSDAQRAASLTMEITNIDDGLLKLALMEEQGLQGCSKYSIALNTVMDLYIRIGDADNGCMYAKKIAKRRWDASANLAKMYSSPLAMQSHPLWKKGTQAEPSAMN